MASRAINKWFAKGRGQVSSYPSIDALLFRWDGRPDGVARYIGHVKRYARNGKEYPSLSALLRAVEAEHRESK